MSSQHDKPKRWRPRFSVRTLAIVVTLVCCYAACSGPTKTQGVEDVLDIADLTHGVVRNTTMLVPLVVVTDERAILQVKSRGLMSIGPRVNRYYFWFFGYVAKLPYARELPIDNPPPVDQPFDPQWDAAKS